MILLTPGPCMTSDRVRQAAAQPDLNHRDPRFLELLSYTKERLIGLYPSDHRAYVIGGSGTAAVEAMLTSCIDKGPVLVLENGYYSDRSHVKLDIHGIPHERIDFGWLGAYDLNRVEESLRSGGFEAVIATHNETTVGRLNPIGELGMLCERYGVRLMVDAMSSFGADEVPLQHVSAMASSANKCLHGLPGISFVLVRSDLADRMSGFVRRTYYLSLPMYEGLTPPLTPPVPALSCLAQALRELVTVEDRRSTYTERAIKVRTAGASLGLTQAITQNEMSSSLTALSLPEGWTSDEWLKASHEQGFMLYACKGELKQRFFQVANMGELPPDAIDSWIEVCRRLMLSTPDN